MSSAFQFDSLCWALNTFGKEVAYDKKERCHRFIEEALELVQTFDVTAKEAHQIVDYVFSRPVGEAHQELGGTMVCLAILCEVSSMSMNIEGAIELNRCWMNQEKIRAKHARKPKFSPLPGATI